MGTDGKVVSTTVSFRVAARLSNRSLAIGLVERLVEHVSAADREFCNAITTAFGEAFNNVVIHGYRHRSDGVLDVEAELGADYVTLKLIDTGVTADLSNVPAPDLDGLPEGGLGIFMMQSLMDEVVYRGGTPNVLSLTKRMTSSASQ
ncbi:MAG: ATP-binding protein [Deltaproteobacteria bacterium]|nr:ATP-binding protein [Deltaproteobacteria bacterium]